MSVQGLGSGLIPSAALQSNRPRAPVSQAPATAPADSGDQQAPAVQSGNVGSVINDQA